MTIEEMKKRKRELGWSNKELARRCELPLGTVQKIFSGETAAPRAATIQALEKALRKNPDMIRESGVAYNYQSPKKEQGEYTLEDYYALPEERRVELIDGVIYDMAAPGNLHQALVMKISARLEQIAAKGGEKCMVYQAPFDVQLDQDDYTMVQPDISVICNRDRLRKFGCFGAPDLVVEILSPSTSKKDLLIKLPKYIHAGVREYWIVNPAGQQIVVYKNRPAELELTTYTFDENVPVGIWGDRFFIDFARIREETGFLYSLE